MNNAINKDPVIANVAVNDDFICVDLATDETHCWISFHHRPQFIDNDRNKKPELGLSFWGYGNDTYCR